MELAAFGNTEILVAGAVISLLAIVGKVVSGVGVISRGIDRRLVGVGMIPRGEVGLIFAALGANELREVVGAGENAIVVLMVVITTLVAPLMLHRMLRRRPLEPDAAEEATTAAMGKILDSPVTGSPEQDATQQPPPDG